MLILAMALLIGVNSSHAQQSTPDQRRIALVIGNDEYEEISSLEKAVNDAVAISQSLSDMGFEVTTARNIGRRAMSRAVNEFEKTIQPGDLTLFYYAGHGFSVSGQDFLLPVDIPQAGPGDESLVRDEAFLTNDLADRFLSAGAKTAILILDACRDNPFAVPGKRSIGGAGGLANQPLGEGIFVLYSAGQYQSALDGMGPGDNNPNSVFTRSLLVELRKPNASIVDIAKSTQVSVRDLASQIGHVQLPSYYDQILGSVTLNPQAANVGVRGSTNEFQEGSTVAMLPRVDPAPKTGKGNPVASFTRSNAGWQATISLPEAAIQFGYRIGEDGEFVDAGTMPNIDQRTGKPMPVTWFALPPDQPAGTIYVTWRDKRGEEAGVFPINFDPDEALRAGQKQILEQLWTAWVAFPDSNKGNVYFTHLISYRCGISRVEYAYNNSDNFKQWTLPECDPSDPHRIPTDANIWEGIPDGAENMQVVVTYFDGSQSAKRNFNVK
ncbi:MAG: caspase family protein [Pseudomonadota bacterium]